MKSFGKAHYVEPAPRKGHLLSLWPHLLQQRLSDKLEKLGEPPAQLPVELPAQPLGGSYPGQPSSGHHPAPGCTRAVGHGIGCCFKRLLNPCACYNLGSVLGKGSNESYLDYKNKPPAAPEPSEEVLRPFAFRLPSESRPPLGEPPNVPMQRSDSPKG